MQDVFVRLLSAAHWAALDPDRDRISYLVVVAQHLAADWLRRQRRQERWTREVVASVDAEAGAASYAGPQPLELDWPLAYIPDCIAELPADLRAAYDVRFVRGLSQREAAAAMGVTRRRIRALEEELLRAVNARLSSIDGARAMPRDSDLRQRG